VWGGVSAEPSVSSQPCPRTSTEDLCAVFLILTLRGGRCCPARPAHGLGKVRGSHRRGAAPGAPVAPGAAPVAEPGVRSGGLVVDRQGAASLQEMFDLLEPAFDPAAAVARQCRGAASTTVHNRDQASTTATRDHAGAHCGSLPLPVPSGSTAVEWQPRSFMRELLRVSDGSVMDATEGLWAKPDAAVAGADRGLAAADRLCHACVELLGVDGAAISLPRYVGLPAAAFGAAGAFGVGGAWWRPSGLLAVVVLLGAAAVTGRRGVARSNRRPRLASSGPMSCPAPDQSSSPAPSEKDTSVSLDDLDQAPSSGCACGGPAAAARASGLHTATPSADCGPVCVAASSCVCASTQASQGPAGSRPADRSKALASPPYGQPTVRLSTARGL